MHTDLLLVFLFGSVLAMPVFTIRGYSTVADSPATLVLEEYKGPRVLGAIGLLVLAGLFYFGDVPLEAPLPFGWKLRDALPLLGLLAAASIVRGLERVRLVFDAGSGTVERTSRLLPWRRFRRPLGDIARIETSSRAVYMYGEDRGSDQFLHLVFRDGSKLLVEKSHDSAVIARLAARLGQFRK